MELTKIFEFSAAHRLPDYKGQCNNLHGHTWKVEIPIVREVCVWESPTSKVSLRI